MQRNISIVGAGLVGSLLSILLKKEGLDVSIYEKRKDPRKANLDAGRSINLALSHRGIRPLKSAGVYDMIEPFLIPMKGRMMHSENSNFTSQPYGKEGQFINSVSRAQLNELLIEKAEEVGVDIHFDTKCTNIEIQKSELHFEGQDTVHSDLIVGTDGAFSAVRQQMQTSDRFNYSQHYIEHGYKELTIHPKGGDFQLDPNYLHIWPRGNFMLIALPNADKTFTCTLFFPFEGNPSFDSLKSKQDVIRFFEKYFHDVLDLIPNLTDQYFANPTASLVTIKCEPWFNNRTIIIGDAAHAIVPFYGQGMNSGFEDARIFVETSRELNWNWDQVLPRYASERKKDADAISDLALNNFIEMRDHVGDPDFLRRKSLEAKIQEAHPKEWLPLYSMVTFSDIPYLEALKAGNLQKRVMDEFLKLPDHEIDFGQVVERFNTLKKDG